MNLYDEFFSIIEIFEQESIDYAVIGGVALAFHNQPRFTRDIDIIIRHSNLKKVETLLESRDFFKSTDPHKFLNVSLILHRFIKTRNNDHLMIDILVSKKEEFSKIFDNAIRTDWEKGKVSIANRKDLIWLKKFRNSDQDKTDIKNLSADEGENED